MGLLKLSDQQAEELSNRPDIAMALQVVQLPDESFAYVIGDHVVMKFDESLPEALSNLLSQPWLQQAEWSDSPVGAQRRFTVFDEWLETLPSAPQIQKTFSRDELIAFGVITPPTLPKAPSRPPFVYGHLAFKWISRPNEVFYRWEPFPRSRRINRSAGTIKADPYAAPSSELALVPSGFAAVARYALQNLTPACFRYELQPVPGTVLECGASVPLYGQSGGGVEVRFTNLSKNRGVVGVPIRLSPL